MKTYTKKQFEKEVMRVIKKLNNEELETVRIGLYILFYKIKENTDCLKIEKLNTLSAFLMDITCMTASETIKRIRELETRNKEMPEQASLFFFYTPSIKDAKKQDTLAIVWPTASMTHKLASYLVCQVHILYTRGVTPLEKGQIKE